MARGSGVWPVYEDFKPTSEWHPDADSHNLILSLPGFMKEQLRVSTEGRNVIRVRGERLIAGNKWSRFLEDFEVPEDSDMNSVRAKFHEGALTITLPKKMVYNPHESTSAKGKKEASKGLETQDDDAESKESTWFKEKHRGMDGEEGGALKKTGVKEEKKSERNEELGEDETARKFKLKMEDGAAATHDTKEKGKEGKLKQVIESSGADHGAFTKKAVKGLAQLNEERQLMVNIGAAVLVIVALSAFVTYKFVSTDCNK